MSTKGWFGFDLDGTVAFYESYGDGSIGAPIKPMIRRIRHYLKQGRIVKFVTARVHPSHGLEAVTERQKIESFCQEQFGQVLPVVCEKDMHMIALFDDRAEQVIPNKGILVREELRHAVQALRDIEVDPTDAYLKAAAALSKLDEWSLKLASAE
jgi:hypothetical protein